MSDTSQDWQAPASSSDGNQIVRLDVRDLGVLEKSDGIEKTDDDPKYRPDSLNSRIEVIYRKGISGTFVDDTSVFHDGEPFGLLLDQTHFYAEAGGQEHDIGRIVSADSRTTLPSSRFTTTMATSCIETLGHRVEQKGSLVSAGRLRLDYSHDVHGGYGLEEMQLFTIEETVNGWISRGSEVYTAEVELTTAQKIPGIQAVFGERYPDRVRVVSIGVTLEEILADVDNQKWISSSVELCGGTHTANIRDIKNFVIVGEGLAAKGIRRVVAVTDGEAREALRKADEFSDRLDRLAVTQGDDQEVTLRRYWKDLGKQELPLFRMRALMARARALQTGYAAEHEKSSAARFTKVKETLRDYFTNNPAAKAFIGVIDSEEPYDRHVLKAATYYGKKGRMPMRRAIYVTSFHGDQGNVGHQNFVSEEMVRETGLKANEWLAEVSQIIGGKGGGGDISATGTGHRVDNEEEAVTRAREYFERCVGAGSQIDKKVVNGLEELAI